MSDALDLADNLWADWFSEPTPETLRNAAAELRRLHAEVEALRKDAERYRWLKQEHERFDPVCHLSWKKGHDRNGSEWVNTHSLNVAIDAAMKEQTMNENTEREAFEAWAIADGFDCEKNQHGRYVSNASRYAWGAWQARAALASQAVPLSQDEIDSIYALHGGDGGPTAICEVFAPALIRAMLAATPAPAPEATPERVHQLLAALTTNDDAHARARFAIELRALYRATPAQAQQADDWRKYATEREDTAQQVIERHRREHDCLLKLLAADRKTIEELRATKAEAKPLTDEQIIELLYPIYDGLRSLTPITDTKVARAVEAACAEAWGVKLAGIGASSGGKP